MPMFENFNQDSNGNPSVVGIGTPGTPSGGVVSVQGESGMTPVKTSGNGAAGTPDSGVSTIQGIAGMTPIKASGNGTAGSPDSGVLTIQGISGAQPVSVVEASASTAAITSVASSATSVSLLSANANRKGFVLYNNSGQKAFVAFASTSTTASFTVLMAPNSLFEAQTLYTGAISAIWQSANGAMLVTELT